MKYSLLFILILPFAGAVHGQMKWIGDWYGTLRVTDAQSLPLVFHLKDSTTGALQGSWDSPEQGAFGQPFSSVQVDGDSLWLTIDRISASYRGKLLHDSITGIFQQRKFSFPMDLSRAKPKAAALVPGEQNVVVTARDGGALGGILMASDKAAPLVIIVAGSGPTDKNENGPGLKTNGYMMLAHALDSAGVGSFRYDKRGIAGSSKALGNESDLRFEHYVHDLEDVVNYFKKQGYQKIFIAGHSEGSLLALIAAQQAPVAGVISIAGAGLPAAQVITKQISKQPMPPALKKQAEDILQSVEKGKQVDSVPKMLYALLRPDVQPYLISWFKYDPREQIQKLMCPVLILQGTCDIQVAVENATDLFNASKTGQIEIIPQMSHTLKDAGKDCAMQMKTYSDPAVPLAAGLVDQIVGFVSGK